MRHLRWIAGAVLAIGLLVWPETALNAAREAMWTWTQSVAPALFPFMAMMPLLTCADATRFYERLLSRAMRPLLGLPGSAAPAVVIGMTAGSPAGALAAAKVAGNPAELERLATCVCGLSPAFLITGIGASMLGSAADGRMLLRAQLLTQMVMLAATRRRRASESPAAPQPAAGESSMSGAVMGVLSVCGYMVVFNVAAALLAKLVRRPEAGTALLCLLDLPSGAKALAALSLSRETRMILLAAATGFGGLCIAAQNLSVSRVSAAKYLLARAVAAMLMAGIVAAELRLDAPQSGKIPEILPVASLIACLMTIPAWISTIKTHFLTKEIPSKTSEILLEEGEKPQDIAHDLNKRIKIM